MEEVEAIRRCQNGETEAFGLLVKTYGAAAFRSAYLFVGNREYAEDLSQEAFVRAFKKITTFDVKRSFYPWYYRILRNLCLNHLRRRRVRAEVPLPEQHFELAHQGPSPSDRAVRTEEKRLLALGLNRLVRDDREIIALVDLQAMRYREVSEALSIPIGTVMSRLYRARKNLLKEIQELERREP